MTRARGAKEEERIAHGRVLVRAENWTEIPYTHVRAAIAGLDQ